MKVSVIVTCYNQEAFLNESLGSVARQTYLDWECIIIDDGSTDTSAQIAKSWQEKDARFKYVYQANKGCCGARNTGLYKAEGDLIQFLDGDDILQPTKLEESVKVFSREKCDVVVTNFSEEHNGELHPPFCDLTKYDFTYKNLLLQWDIDFNVPAHCFCFTKEILAGLTFKEFLKAKEDWIMWLEVLKRNPKVCFINQPLVMYRIHGGNITRNTSLMEQYTEAASIYILKNEDTYFEEFYQKMVKPYKDKLNRILSRPWYKKVFYDITGKE